MGTKDPNGRYRSRKDWGASGSIGSLVDIDEHADDDAGNQNNGMYRQDTKSPESLSPPGCTTGKKKPRRSSLVLSLFSNKSEKGQKRRSSISVPFFRRSEGSKVINQMTPTMAQTVQLECPPTPYYCYYYRIHRKVPPVAVIL